MSDPLGELTNGTGVVNQTGGVWNNGGQQLRLGDVVDSSGEYHISDGVLTNASYVYIGRYGSGTMSISGGVVIDTGTVIAGEYGTGTVSISGNALVDTARIYTGNRAGSDGVLSITGSVASIQVTQYRGGNAGTGTLRLTPDAGGISAINVVDDGTSSAGKAYVAATALVVDFSDYDSTEDLIIMNYDTAFTGPFASRTWLPLGRTATVTASGGVVRVTDISGPLGTLITIR